MASQSTHYTYLHRCFAPLVFYNYCGKLVRCTHLFAIADEAYVYQTSCGCRSSVQSPDQRPVTRPVAAAGPAFSRRTSAQLPDQLRLPVQRPVAGSAPSCQSSVQSPDQLQLQDQLRSPVQRSAAGPAPSRQSSCGRRSSVQPPDQRPVASPALYYHSRQSVTGSGIILL